METLYSLETFSTDWKKIGFYRKRQHPPEVPTIADKISSKAVILFKTYDL